MSEEDCNCEPCPEEGLPQYMGTFADLMALLMCFFVLLLSFSEMDAMKFKRLAGSMAQAFGVQAKLKLIEVPKGTSIIAQEFSPGKPEPTPINVIFQQTDDLTEMSLEVDCAEEYDVEQGAESKEEGVAEALDAEHTNTTSGELHDEAMASEIASRLADLVEETQADAMELAKALQGQIAAGQVEVETHGREIIIRIREKGSFTSGSADLHHGYIPVLRQVRNVLAGQRGKISIQGHTDNIPISTRRFRSNWELSASRAVSVAEELLAGGIIDPNRITISGFGDTRPLNSNDTPEERSRNRRVEIVIHQGIDEETRKEIEFLQSADPEKLRELELAPLEGFELRADEVF